MPDGPFSSTAPLFWLTPQWVKSRMLDRFEPTPEAELVANSIKQAQVIEDELTNVLAEWRAINGERGSRA